MATNKRNMGFYKTNNEGIAKEVTENIKGLIRNGEGVLNYVISNEERGEIFYIRKAKRLAYRTLIAYRRFLTIVRNDILLVF